MNSGPFVLSAGRTPHAGVRVLVALGLVAAVVVAELGEWQGGGAYLHSHMEVVAALLALMVGILILGHWRISRDDTMLLVGMGFLGAGVLDALHALVTNPQLAVLTATGTSALAPWSWLTSRVFLAGMLAATLLVIERPHAGRLSPSAVVAGALVYLVFCGAVFWQVPLGPAHVPDLFLHRPQELLPGVLFAVALGGHLVRGGGLWRSRPFHFWLQVALLVSVVVQMLVMPRSAVVFDEPFEMAHLLKLASYGAVLLGLVTEISMLWHRELDLSGGLRRANEQLEEGVRDRTEALAQAVNVLERSNRELQQFAYATSHDLKTPLRAVSIYLELLERRLGSGLDKEARDYLQRAMDSARQMYTLIQSLLDYSRIGTGGQPFEEVNLAEAAADVVARLEPEVPPGGGAFTLGELPPVHGDPGQIRQLLQNLFENALKYGAGDNRKVQVTATVEYDMVQVCVEDNGIGIAQEDHDRIFEVFRRLHRSDEYPGAGIGLSVCQRIVLRHGGDIWVESTPGEGSRFWFTLPRDAAAADRQTGGVGSEGET